MSKASDVKKVEKNTQKMIELGFVRVHPWIPADKRDQALEYCKVLRDTHELEKGNDDE